MEEKISAMSGDFSKDAFGMTETAYESLAGVVDTVIHNGAKVDYTAPYANHKDVNVDGTAQVVKFCFRGFQKSLHFLSTLAVFGPIGFTLGLKDLHEDTDLLPSIEPLQADMGYAQSKWVAEQVLGLAKKRGLRASVFRPGFILCDGQTGLSNTADFMVRCTIACIRLGYYPLLYNQCKEMLTVNFASAAILALTKEERHLNKNYHLVRHDVKKQPSITEYFELLREHGYELRAMVFRDWVDILSRACMEEDRHPMLPLMPMMAETIRDDRTRWEVYDDMPAIHCDNLHASLVGTGVNFTNIDHDLLGKYLGHFQAKGLLPSQEQTDEPVNIMTMKLRRSSSMRFKYRPGGRRMTRLSSFLSEAGSDRASLLFTATGGAGAANRLSLVAPNRGSSSGGTANGALGGVSTSLQSGDHNSQGWTNDYRYSRPSTRGAQRDGPCSEYVRYLPRCRYGTGHSDNNSSKIITILGT
jgi:thioester reductase-like protein